MKTTTSDKFYYYDFIVYEVWGNKRDGFQINQSFVQEKDIVLSAETVEGTDKGLIKALKKLNLIDKGIHYKSINIEGESQYTLYFEDVRQVVGGLCPAFELRCTKIIGGQTT